MNDPRDGAPVELRRATEDDVEAVLTLARRTLGWDDSDTTRSHFRWKHFDNPAGRSDLWVAEVDGTVVGLRAFLRWDLLAPDGRTVRAARAVDTGTDAPYRRRGIFTRLTTAGLDHLRADGVELVFNTPNRQSRPANLTLGWEVVGRLPAVVRPSGPRGLVALVRARAPAERRAVPTTVGTPAGEVFGDPARAAALIARLPAPRGLATLRTPQYLAWRYGHDALHYRVVDLDGAVAVFHLRRRGRALEAVICDGVPAPGAGPHATLPAALVRRIGRETGADYLIGLAAPRRPGPGFLPVPGTGPILATRAVVGPAPTDRAAWDLQMGDIEGL